MCATISESRYLISVQQSVKQRIELENKKMDGNKWVPVLIIAWHLWISFKLAISHDSLVKLSDIEAKDLFIQMFFYMAKRENKKLNKGPMKMEGLIGKRIRQDKGLQALYPILNKNAKQLIRAL